MGTVPYSPFPRQPRSATGALSLREPICHRAEMARKPHYIKEWRKHRGLTQEQLAARIEIDRSYLVKIENGKRRYDQPFLEAAALALRCEPADLIMRDPTQPNAIWSIWDKIPPQQREQAARILEVFAKKTGTES